MSTIFRRSDSAPESTDLADELSAVRSLETSIAERLQAARGSRDIVDAAGREADEILTRAQVQAADAAERARAEIMAAATLGAERLRTAAEGRCAAIVATSRSRRASDVPVIVDGVLPALASSTTQTRRHGTAP